MAAGAPYNVRWGIMATGWIAEEFTKDLLIDSSVRGAGDISHTIVSVASSSSKTKAEDFISRFKIPAPCAAYGTYEELVNDPKVDVIYIATPHSHHFQNAMLALEAGKNVLCEKAFTVNAKQAEILVETARTKKVFLMEAVWTRFFPVSIQIREAIKNGEIGEVVRVIADTSGGSGDEAEEEWGVKHRMVNMDLAGGALLDLGVYSLTWVFQALYHTIPLSERQPPSGISAQITPYSLTAADENTSVILQFPRSAPSGKYKSHGIALTSIRASSDPDEKFTAGPAIRIQGTKGEIQVMGHAFHPDSFRVIPCKVAGEPAKPIREVISEFPGNGKGMYWEADEVARCVRDGKLESETMSWEESLVIMRVMDEIRKQGGLVYPENIESTQYPLQL